MSIRSSSWCRYRSEAINDTSLKLVRSSCASLASVQPNPINRLIRCLQSAEPDVGDRALDFICQEMGGHFVRHEAVDDAAVNAVKECAEAIAAISDGHVSDMDLREVREAISALSSLIISLRDARPGE